MTQARKTANPKVTIIASKGANQAINYLLEDRDELEWLVAIGRNKNGDIFSTIPAAISSKTWALSNTSKKESCEIISAKRMNKRRARGA